MIALLQSTVSPKSLTKCHIMFGGHFVRITAFPACVTPHVTLFGYKPRAVAHLYKPNPLTCRLCTCSRHVPNSVLQHSLVLQLKRSTLLHLSDLSIISPSLTPKHSIYLSCLEHYLIAVDATVPEFHGVSRVIDHEENHISD